MKTLDKNSGNEAPAQPEPKSAVVFFDCPVRELRVKHTKFYHFNWRGCCSVYSYLYMAFCGREEECRQMSVYDRCPLLKELMEQNEQ